MAAITKIVPEKDMEILKKYLSDPAVVLIDESVLDKLSEKDAAYIRKNDGRVANYDFCGEADVWVDVVTATDHLFIDFISGPEDE